MNDITYIFFFVIFFLFMGSVVPLVNEEFSSSYDSPETNDLLDDDQGTFLLIIPTIILNVFALPFWTFGLPLWVNIWIMLPLRVVFGVVIARNIWVGGGS